MVIGGFFVWNAFLQSVKNGLLGTCRLVQSFPAKFKLYSIHPAFSSVKNKRTSLHFLSNYFDSHSYISLSIGLTTHQAHKYISFLILYLFFG